MQLYLTFHGIGVPGGDIVADERPYWITKPDFVEFMAGIGSVAQQAGVEVVSTFDDGNRSDLDIALPILQKHGMHGIFFPCTGRIGRPGYLDACDIRSITAAGFEIGSQGVDHVPWRGLPEQQLHHEIGGSKAVLEDILGNPVASAAMPFGSYDAAALAMLKRAGYQTVYSCDAGLAKPGTWFRRRWSYHIDRPFNICRMASQSRSPAQRVLSVVKHQIKSWR